jgi:hypothetical protein
MKNFQLKGRRQSSTGNGFEKRKKEKGIVKEFMAPANSTRSFPFKKMQNCLNVKCYKLFSISHLKRKHLELEIYRDTRKKKTQNETVKIVHKSKSMSFF